MGQFAGAVLTGGAGRRFGGGKPLAPVRGRPLGGWVVGALRGGGCDPVVTVGGDTTELGALGADGHVEDEWPGEGPLGGTIAALDALFASTSPPRFVLVGACDLPRLDASTVARMLDVSADADIAVARGERLHPSLTRWSRRGAAGARARFEAGERAMHRFISAATEPPHELAVLEVEIDEERLVNVNTPDDVDGAGGVGA